MIPMGWMTKDDDAVSETMGYILIFSIAITCITIILLAGNGVIDSAKSQNNFKNMEQGFTVLCSDLKQVALEGTPVKTTRIHMEGGAASAKAFTNKLTVTYDGVDRYGPQFTGNMMFTSDREGSIVSLENGGLWEKQGMGSADIVVLEPRIYKTADDTGAETLVLNIIRLDADPESAVGGSTTMDTTLTDKGTIAKSYDALPAKDVVITFFTNYPDAWKRFYEKKGAAAVSYNDRVVATFPGISKLVISEHVVGTSMS